MAGSTSTPRGHLPNTAIQAPMTTAVTLAFAIVLVGSIGTLAFATIRRRR